METYVDRQLEDQIDDFSLPSTFGRWMLDISLERLSMPNKWGLSFLSASSGGRREVNKVFTVVESPSEIIAWDAYLFHDRIYLVLRRILMHCDNYQCLTSQLPIYAFITFFCSKHDAKLVSRGRWKDIVRGKSLSFWFSGAVSCLASIPVLLLEALCPIYAPCTCRLPTNSQPQSPPGDHLTDWLSWCTALVPQASHCLAVSGLPGPHLGDGFSLPWDWTSSSLDNATNFTIQWFLSTPSVRSLEPSLRKMALFPQCSFLGFSASALLANKIQQGKFKDHEDIKQFTNQAPSHLASRRVLKGSCTKWKVFIGRRVRQGSY